ncbi:helix-turn-helix domain-containing protein [Lysinibacillus sp. NPDC096418]|uniref:helix-turn-helix domain-containing protein n=1 Tax=Lysinibacillus sp. NPDC096418 TaxID=3364138 RepID=UPI0037FEC75A
MNINKAIATRMAELAEERNSTITEIGRWGGLKQTTVSEIMCGRSKHPKISTIQAYCNGCGITLTEFFDSPLFGVVLED